MLQCTVYRCVNNNDMNSNDVRSDVHRPGQTSGLRDPSKYPKIQWVLLGKATINPQFKERFLQTSY